MGQIWHPLERDRPRPVPDRSAWSRLRPEQLGDGEDSKKSIPLGRFGDHQELANLAAYLLSDFSAYITGDCITIDGGAWLHGASHFNELDRLSSSEWDALQASMKRKK